MNVIGVLKEEIKFLKKTYGINNLRPINPKGHTHKHPQNNKRNQQTMVINITQHQWSQLPNKKGTD